MKRFIAAALLVALTTSSVAYGHVGHPHIHKGRPSMGRNPANPDRIDDAVMSAAGKGDVAALRKLFADGATANIIDSETPLIAAADGGHVDTVRFLLTHGADVNSENDGGATSLDLAENDEKRATNSILRTKYAEIIAILKKAGVKTGSSRQDNKKQPVAVQQFPDPRSTDDLVTQAAFIGNVAALRRLFAHGAVANCLDAGTMPLVAAADGGHVDAVQFLLAHGAYVTSENDGDETSLELAVNDEKRATDPVLRAKYDKIITMLKKAGEKT